MVRASSSSTGLVGVRVPPRVELHRLRHQHRAPTVDVDGSALVDEERRDPFRTGGLGDHGGDPSVTRPGRPCVRAPAVEHPVHRAEPSVVVLHERRPDVPHPEVVERGLEHVDRTREQARGVGAGDRVDDDRDRLVLGDRVRRRRPCGAGSVSARRVVAEGRARARERHPRAVLEGCLRRHPPGHARAPVVCGPSARCPARAPDREARIASSAPYPSRRRSTGSVRGA